MTADTESPLYRAFMMLLVLPRRTKNVPMMLAMMETPPMTSGYSTAGLYATWVPTWISTPLAAAVAPTPTRKVRKARSIAATAVTA